MGRWAQARKRGTATPIHGGLAAPTAGDFVADIDSGNIVGNGTGSCSAPFLLYRSQLESLPGYGPIVSGGCAVQTAINVALGDSTYDVIAAWSEDGINPVSDWSELQQVVT